MMTIDGSKGEGGGQILRTSLALSLVTGQPVRLVNIRAGRRKPGLMRQHLTGLRASAQVGDAEVTGDEVGSQEVTFRPRGVRPGHYEFAVGTAGSATLVFQTVLPALLRADGPSHLILEGGTHNEKAPPFDFLEKAFLPLLARMGPRVTARLHRPGFFPAGGGRIQAEVTPAPLQPLTLMSRGAILRRSARALLAHLPRHIGERELARVQSRLSWPDDALCIEHPDARGPGNALLLEIEAEHLTEVFSGFGRRGVSSERVADEAVDEAREWLAADVPVGPHLCDQLIMPLAMAGGGAFRTVPPTTHTTTQIETVRRFLDVPIALEQVEGRVWEVRVG